MFNECLTCTARGACIGNLMQKVMSIILIYKPTYKVVGLARETLLLSLIRPLPITSCYIYTYMYAYTIPDSQGWAPQWLCNLGGLGVSEQALGGIPLDSGIVVIDKPFHLSCT